MDSGYLNKPDLNKDKFIFTKFDNGPIYKTGDLARYLTNGEIQYIGRNDFQVKIRGLRIELQEIEERFLEHTNILKAIVLNKKIGMVNQLVAYYTSKDGEEILDLRTFLASKLPTYMIPNYIIKLDTMPLNSNGKIDRSKLLDLDIKISSSNYVAPRNSLENDLCEIWSNLLGCNIGIEDNFFELGADSLIAINFKTLLLKSNINIDISYGDLFKYPTIKLLCENCLQNNKKNERDILYDADYTSINELLCNNIKQNIPDKIENKNICPLLLGVTGFVGAHILADYIDNYDGKIFCIVREKYGISIEDRLIETLKFYFGNKYLHLIGNRIIAIKGDIIYDNFGLDYATLNKLLDNINIVINSSAVVKHYGDYELFKLINIDGTKNIINFCRRFHKKLLHLSTLSVSGNMSIEENITNSITLKEKTFYEKDLFIGQDLNNAYVKSKFIAEKLVLENILLGLKAIILRLGNITNRYSDGMFQSNMNENAFFNRLQSFLKIGVIPEYLSNTLVEFTPVDICANAILKIASAKNNNFNVIHIYNPNHITVKEMVNIFKELNINVNMVSEDRFYDILINNSKDDFNTLSSFVNDMGKDKKVNYGSNIKIKSDFSIAYLKKLGFKWPKITVDYLKKYINFLIKNIFSKEEK